MPREFIAKMELSTQEQDGVIRYMPVRGESIEEAQSRVVEVQNSYLGDSEESRCLALYEKVADFD